MANWRGRLDSLNLGYKLLELLDCVQPESGLWYYQRGFWRGQSLWGISQLISKSYSGTLAKAHNLCWMDNLIGGLQE